METQLGQVTEILKNAGVILDDRQIQEVLFAMVYEMNFGHGTTGHNDLIIISKLFKALQRYDTEMKISKN